MVDREYNVSMSKIPEGFKKVRSFLFACPAKIGNDFNICKKTSKDAIKPRESIPMDSDKII